MGVDNLGAIVRPTPEVSAAIVRALGMDPLHVVIDSVKLTPWNSRHTAMLRFEAVYILQGTPAEVQAMVEVSEPLTLVDW